VLTRLSVRTLKFPGPARPTHREGVGDEVADSGEDPLRTIHGKNCGSEGGTKVDRRKTTGVSMTKLFPGRQKSKKMHGKKTNRDTQKTDECKRDGTINTGEHRTGTQRTTIPHSKRVVLLARGVDLLHAFFLLQSSPIVPWCQQQDKRLYAGVATGSKTEKKKNLFVEEPRKSYWRTTAGGAKKGASHHENEDNHRHNQGQVKLGPHLQ